MDKIIEGINLKGGTFKIELTIVNKLITSIVITGIENTYLELHGMSFLHYINMSNNGLEKLLNILNIYPEKSALQIINNI